MGDVWIIDMTHFLDSRGQPVSSGGSQRIAKHFGAIVSILTTNPPATIHEISLSCRRRPNRKACTGKIHAGFEPGTANIIWSCPVCNDQGLIHHWQNTIWDKGGRAGLPQVNKITYRHGFADYFDEDVNLDSTVLDGSAITHDILIAIHDNEILGTSGIWGDPAAGDPIQIDLLEIEHPGGPTRITLYNRAIMLFATNDELFVQIHRVCCAIDKH